MKSILQATLNTSFYFDPDDSASSNSGGVPRHGIARTYYGTSLSQLSVPPDASSRLFFDRTSGSLHIFHDSSSSTLLGGTLPTGFIAGIGGANLAIPPSGSTITLTSPLYETPSSLLTGTTTAFVVPSGLSGVWDVAVTSVWSDNGPNEVAIAVTVNGEEACRATALKPVSGLNSRIYANVYQKLVLQSGDTVEFVAGSTSTGSLVATAGGVAATRISMFRLGN